MRIGVYIVSNNNFRDLFVISVYVICVQRAVIVREISGLLYGRSQQSKGQIDVCLSLQIRYSTSLQHVIT